MNGAVRQECCSHDFTPVVDGVRHAVPCTSRERAGSVTEPSFSHNTAYGPPRSRIGRQSGVRAGPRGTHRLAFFVDAKCEADGIPLELRQFVIFRRLPISPPRAPWSLVMEWLKPASRC